MFFVVVFQLAEQVDDVRISCDENLALESQQINVSMKWNFRVETEVRLDRQICAL